LLAAEKDRLKRNVPVGTSEGWLILKENEAKVRGLEASFIDEGSFQLFGV